IRGTDGSIDTDGLTGFANTVDPFYGPVAPAGPSQIALGALQVFNVTGLTVTPSPATGWTTDSRLSSTTEVWFGHRSPSAIEDHHADLLAASPTGGNAIASVVVVGSPAAP